MLNGNTEGGRIITDGAADQSASTGQRLAGELQVIYIAATDDAAAAVKTRLERAAEDVTVVATTDGDAVIDRIVSGDGDVLLYDVTDRARDRTDLIGRMRAARPELPILVAATEDTTARAIATGASDVTTTPLSDLDGAELLGRIAAVRDHWRRSAWIDRERELSDLHQIVNTVGDAVYHLDESGRFVMLNDPVAEMTGYDEEELLGEHVSLILDDEDLQAGNELITELLRSDGREIGEFEMDAHTKDGEVIPTENRLAILRDDDGEFRGTVGVVRDVSGRQQRKAELQRQRDELQRQRDELERLNRINVIIRGVDKALVGATTGEEIEQSTCERLADSAAYEFAWIHQYNAVTDSVALGAVAGIGRRDLSAVAELDVQDRETTEANPLASQIRATAASQELHVTAVDDFPTHAGASAYDGAPSVAVASIPIYFEADLHGVLTVCTDYPDAFDESERNVLAELGTTVGHALTAASRKHHVERLTQLQEAARQLLGTHDQSEVADIVVHAASEALDIPAATVYIFDEQGNAIAAVASVGDPAPRVGERLSPAAADDVVWQVYVGGNRAIVEEADEVSLPIEGARSGLFVPIGGHGVFAATASTPNAFDPDTVELTDILVANAEAALDRLSYETELYKRDSELEAQNRRLTELNRINEIIREVDQAMIRSTTREEIDTAVCERLTDEDRFALAWIGQPDPTGEELAMRSWSGSEGGYLDRQSFELSPQAAEPSVVTARTGDTTVVSNVGEGLQTEQWRKAALAQGFQSAISVPLVYDEFNYGVLTVFATEPRAFDESRDVFEELGQTIGYAINAMETKRGLLADTVVELDLRIADDNCLIHWLASRLGCEVRFVEYVPQEEGRAHLYFAVAGATSGAVTALAGELVSIEEIVEISGDEDRGVYRATVTGPTIAESVAGYGGQIDTLHSDGEETQLVVDLPATADVRTFVETFQSRYPNAELVARRDHERTESSYEAFADTVERDLTDRQLEVLRTAFLSGFFESPRNQTGTEIADALDISQPTFNHHLRASERKLLSLLFTDDEALGPDDDEP